MELSRSGEEQGSKAIVYRLLLSWQGEIPMTTTLAFNLRAVSCLAMAPAFAQSSNAQEQDKSAKIHHPRAKD